MNFLEFLQRAKKFWPPDLNCSNEAMSIRSSRPEVLHEENAIENFVRFTRKPFAGASKYSF